MARERERWRMRHNSPLLSPRSDFVLYALSVIVASERMPPPSTTVSGFSSCVRSSLGAVRG